jgi:hypothetical protein
MKTYLTILILCLLFAESVQAQRTYKVNYEQDGFKGYVELKVDLFTNGDFSCISFNIKSSSILVISSYKNGKYNQLLTQKGINFPHTIHSQSSFDNLFEGTAQAYFYSTPQMSAIAAYGAMKNYLSVDNSRGCAAYDAEFSEKDINYLKNYYKNHNSNLWQLTGKLGSLSIQHVYFYGFDDQVEKIISDFEKAEQAKKEAEQKEQPSTFNTTSSQSYGGSSSASGRTASSPNNDASTYNLTSTSQSNATSSASSNGPYQDPALNAKYAALEQKRIENEQKLAEMKRKMAEQKRAQERIDQGMQQAEQGMNDMVNSFSSGATERGGLLQGSEQFINGVAQSTGSVGLTFGAGVLSVGMSMWSAHQQNKAREEAERQEEEERQRIQEQQEALERQRQAELERIRQEAFEMLINQRYTLLDAFSEQEPIPLSTSRVENDVIYYFVYATNPTTFNKKETVIYVSNVFAIRRYNDGTWPYQSIVEKEIDELTPYDEVMHGYYMDAGMAERMQKEFVNGFYANEGVFIRSITYRETSMNVSENKGIQNGGSLGVPLDLNFGDMKTVSKKTPGQTSQKENGLGVPLNLNFDDTETAPKKTSDKTSSKESGLGIPLDLDF